MSLLFWIIFCSSLGGILYGYDLGVFSGTIFFIQKDLGLTTSQIGVLGGMVFIGGLIGTMVTGYLSDKFGRRTMIIAGAALFVLGIVGLLLKPNFYHMLYARIVLGTAVGVVSVAVPSYLSEIAPARIRGRSVTIFQLFLTAGILLAYVMDTLLTHSGSWRSMYAISLFPAGLLLVTMLFLPESPRWFASKGQVKKALNILKRIRPLAEAEAEMAGILKSPYKMRAHWRDLFRRELAFPLVLTLLIAILNQLTAINSILLYAPEIFRQAGFHSHTSDMEGSVLIGLINFIGTIIGTLIIDKVGRRSLLMFGTLGVTLSYFFLALTMHWHWPSFCSLAGLLTFIFCFAVGPGSMVWLIMTELLPSNIRGKGLALALFANSLTSWGVSTIFLQMKANIGLIHTYLIFGFFTFFYFILALKYLPETKKKSLEQIQVDMAHR